MTKQELLTALAAKFFKVGTPSLNGNPEQGLQNYLVKCYDKTGDAVRDMNIAFYENTSTGDAYWSPAEPKPTPVPTFQDEVQTALDNAITNDLLKIKAGWIMNVDKINEKADVRVLRGDPSAVAEQYAVVYRDGVNLKFEWYTKS